MLYLPRAVKIVKGFEGFHFDQPFYPIQVNIPFLLRRKFEASFPISISYNFFSIGFLFSSFLAFSSFQRNIKSIRQLVGLPDDKRRALLRSLSDEQYRDVLVVCASMPLLEISYTCEVSPAHCFCFMHVLDPTVILLLLIIIE